MPISSAAVLKYLIFFISFCIKDGPAATIRAKDNHLVTIKKAPQNARAIMQFDNIDLAYQLFTGGINALDCIGKGEIEIKGMVSMVDNLNRILGRVAMYLA